MTADAECVRGEGWEIWRGDCLQMLPLFKDKQFDLALTDPPYGVEMAYSSYHDSMENTQRLLSAMISECKRVAAVTLTTVGRFANEVYLYQTMPPKWRICWRKGITSCASPIGFTDWEPIFVYGDKVHRNSHDLFTVQPEIMGTHGHPCPKPIAWAKWLIERFSKPGDLILDPFLGSGTTGVAAIQTGRRFVGVELDHGYFEIARKRLTDASRAAAKLPKQLAGRDEDWAGLGMFATGDNR